MKWFKKRRNKLFAELIDRRDEVLRRAIMISNRNIPQFLMDEPLPKVLEWVVSPHIYKTWEKYAKIDVKELRGDQSLVYKILGAYSENREKKIERKKDNI